MSEGVHRCRRQIFGCTKERAGVGSTRDYRDEHAGVKDLEHVADVLSGWQYDGGPQHLHPGDLGWHSLRDAATTARSLRVWSREDTVLAIGLLDGPDGLLRMAVDPQLREDEELSRQLVADVQDP